MPIHWSRNDKRSHFPQLDRWDLAMPDRVIPGDVGARAGIAFSFGQRMTAIREFLAEKVPPIPAKFKPA